MRGQLGQVKGQIMGSTSMPTAQQIRSSGELREDLTKVIADTNELIAAIPAIYDALGASGAKPAALNPSARPAASLMDQYRRHASYTNTDRIANFVPDRTEEREQ